MARLRRPEISSEDVLHLYFGERLSAAEVGKRLGCSVWLVTSRIKKAGALLRPGGAKKGKRNPKSSATKRRLYAEGKLIPWNKGWGEYFRGPRNPRYGEPLALETRRKISLAHKGKMTGERNPNWKGGGWQGRGTVLPWEWKIAREECWRRYDYTCVSCLRSGGTGQLAAHHIIPVRELLASSLLNLVLSQDNLICLCRSCHRRLENPGGYDIRLAFLLSYVGYNPSGGASKTLRRQST